MKEHPDTAAVYNNLGNISYIKNKLSEAFGWYFKDLTISEKVFGTEHPITLNAYKNIAEIYEELGDCDKAEKYYRKTL